MAISAIFGNTKNLALNGPDSTISWAKPLKKLKKPNNETMKNKKPPEEPIDISLPPNVTDWNVGIPFMLGSRLHWNQENVRIYLDGTTKVRYEFYEHFLREKYYEHIKHVSLKRSYKPI